MKRYVLLDRDGTIIVERHYLSNVDEVMLLPNAAAGLRNMQAAGLGLAIVTNQAGVARGYLTEARLTEIHGRLLDLLDQEGVQIDGIFYCKHHPDEHCMCRKPGTGMAITASEQLGFDLRESFVIGDKGSDTEMGIRIGATALLVTTGYGTQHRHAAHCHFVVKDLVEASMVIQTVLELQIPA